MVHCYQRVALSEHTGKICRDFLNEMRIAKKVSLMSYPPHSSNLSPAELLRDELVRKEKALQLQNAR